jgi:hypothetical protein
VPKLCNHCLECLNGGLICLLHETTRIGLFNIPKVGTVHKFLARGCVYGGLFRRNSYSESLRILDGPSPIIHRVEALERYPRRHPAVKNRLRSSQQDKVLCVSYTCDVSHAYRGAHMTWHTTWIPFILRTQGHWWLGTIEWTIGRLIDRSNSPIIRHIDLPSMAHSFSRWNVSQWASYI